VAHTRAWYDYAARGCGRSPLVEQALIYGHLVFEDIAAEFGLPGMPHFLRRDEVATLYEKLTGYALRDIEFYMAYAATHWAIAFLRTGYRAVHFREQTRPDDADELIHNADSLRRMLAGEYWR